MRPSSVPGWGGRVLLGSRGDIFVVGMPSGASDGPPRTAERRLVLLGGVVPADAFCPSEPCLRSAFRRALFSTARGRSETRLYEVSSTLIGSQFSIPPPMVEVMIDRAFEA